MQSRVLGDPQAQKPVPPEHQHTVPDPDLLGSIVEKYRPDMALYEAFYRQVHQDPEISGMEAKTASIVASHLERLGFEVHTGIGGHGVAGVYRNGHGKTLLMRAELDALPILEQTDVPYKSTKRMIDRYGNERPVMHACGHDMNMATLLAALDLLRAAADRWSGTVIALFQPDEEETGGAQAMVDDGLYSKVPVPDLMLGQHVVPSRAGTVAIRSGPILVAADSANVRIVGGPCPGVNPQLCVDPIGLAMSIIPTLEDAVHQEIGPHADATVACWGFHAGIPGNDYVAYADFLLDIKTVEPDIRQRALSVIEARIREECKKANVPEDPVVNFTVRAPLTSNDALISGPVSQVFRNHFKEDAVEMKFTRACEDFSTLGSSHNVPYAYWNFGGSQETAGDIPTNHSPFFAPAVQPTLQVGADAMALAALTFLSQILRRRIERTMSNPGATAQLLMLGPVHHAKAEFEQLTKEFKTIHLTSGTREQFLDDCANGGVYDGVVAISRTADSAAFTGLFDAELITRLPSSVKFISHNGAGYDQINVPECTKRGIQVSNTPDVVNDATADTALLLLLAALRKAWIPQSTIRRGTWDQGRPMGRDPAGLTLGVLGLGGIGVATAKRAAAFGMKIQYHNRSPRGDLAEHFAAGPSPQYVGFEELLRTSDVVSVHLPLSPATRHTIGAKEIDMMKQDVVIINTARGPVIDEEALVQGLDSGKVWSAGLDVFEKEPEVHPGLLGNNNVILLPHIGTATVDTRKRMEILVVDNVRSALSQGKLLTQVSEQRSGRAQ
ncbi:uncharacterized protein E0L32_009423 [Thyridium curvatum]|uniref:Uncharacterized protein n=1 Tax=Thyridium curvatum TaxID=1093900 RepID=A0A507AWK7_9PEZI|nr:uncharacterized protein E0L32_009423 [Thyridium curvatum]TPX09379.1 hypothetical protein E0L32_009423 [Thyridium curvatum]